MLFTLFVVVVTYLLAAESFTHFLFPSLGEASRHFKAGALPVAVFDLLVVAAALFIVLGWMLIYANAHGRSIRLPAWVTALQVRLYLFLINRLYLDALALRIGQCCTRMRNATLAIYTRAREMAEKKGIIIADTKLEFGVEGDNIILIDEVLTPDSSRFWPADGYKPGKTPDSFDKQFVRDYLIDLPWDMKSPPPVLPQEIVRKTQEKYTEALKRLTRN